MNDPTLQLSEEEALYWRIQESLYRDFQPHPGQVAVWDAIDRGCKLVFVQCGRNFGKSTSGAYIASRYALERPNSLILFVAPQYNQTRWIIWKPRLIDKHLDDFFVTRKNDQETYFELTNGSTIKCDGSNNYDAHRGIKPDLVIADEYRDFDPEWADVMIPNLLAKNAPIVFLGTPPRPLLASGREHHYYTMSKECQQGQESDPGMYFFLRADSYCNPFIPKERTDKEIARLKLRGDDDVIQREYYAQFIMGGQGRVLPMFDEQKHIAPHEEVLEQMAAEPDQWDAWVGIDPAVRSTLAVNFMATNLYTGVVLWLDELHIEDDYYTSPEFVLPSIYKKVEELYHNPAAVNYVCDNAAASFILAACEHPLYPLFLTPTLKQAGDKFEYIEALKDVFLRDEASMSDRCVHTKAEFLNYRRDKVGNILKKRDHHVDNSRYVLKHSGFSAQKEDLPKIQQKDPMREGVMISMEQDLKDQEDSENWW